MNKDKTAPELKIIGNVMPSGHNVGNIYDPDGISPTIMLNHGYPALILEETTDNDMNQLIQVAQIYDKEKNPTNGRVYDPQRHLAYAYNANRRQLNAPYPRYGTDTFQYSRRGISLHNHDTLRRNVRKQSD